MTVDEVDGGGDYEPSFSDPRMTYHPVRHDFQDVWSWMRVDLWARIVPSIAVPLIWSVIWGGGVSGVGLQVRFDGTVWIWIGLMALVVFGSCVLFASRVLNWSARRTPGALALEVPFFLVINPIAEEILFRGFFQSRLAGLVGFPIAVVSVAFLFGFHHIFAGFRWRFLLWATLGGFLFGNVAEYCQSVVPAVLLHSAADVGLFLVGPWRVANARYSAR